MPYDAPDQPALATPDDVDQALTEAKAYTDQAVASIDTGGGGSGGGASTVLDVDAQFGGDVSKAVTEAERSGGPTAFVWCGGKEYPVTKTTVVSRPITIAGAGRGATRFYHEGSFAGPVFRINQAKRNGAFESTSGSAPITTYDPTKDDGRVEFRDFSIIDNKRDGTQRHGMYLMGLDDCLLSNLWFGMLTGTALKLGADEADKGSTSPASGRIRESNFNDICIYRCGSGSPNGTPDVPAMILQSANGDGDGSNQIFFNQLRFVYNEGRMLINGRNGSNSLRRVMFRDTQLHALADNSNWNPSKYFPFDLVTIAGCVRETFFDGVFINGTKSGTAGWALTGTSGTDQTPKRFVVNNINVVNMAGDVVRVEKGDSVAIMGTSMGACGGKIINNKSGSGLSRYYIHEYGINSPSGKTSGVDGVSGGVYWTGSKV